MIFHKKQHNPDISGLDVDFIISKETYSQNGFYWISFIALISKTETC